MGARKLTYELRHELGWTPRVHCHPLRRAAAAQSRLPRMRTRARKLPMSWRSEQCGSGAAGPARSLLRRSSTQQDGLAWRLAGPRVWLRSCWLTVLRQPVANVTGIGGNGREQRLRMVREVDTAGRARQRPGRPQRLPRQQVAGLHRALPLRTCMVRSLDGSGRRKPSPQYGVCLGSGRVFLVFQLQSCGRSVAGSLRAPPSPSMVLRWFTTSGCATTR